MTKPKLVFNFPFLITSSRNRAPKALMETTKTTRQMKKLTHETGNWDHHNQVGGRRYHF